MLLIACPWCGPRAETEFDYGGEAGIVRPADPDALNDAEWADYLFCRSNPRGAHRELWNHAQGCRRWFGVERDTVTYRIEYSFVLTPAEIGRTAGDGTASDAGTEVGAEIEAAAKGEASIADGTGTDTSVSAESGSASSDGTGG